MSSYSSHQPSTNKRVQTYVERAGLPVGRTAVRELAGDASARRFVRLCPPGGPTRVLVVHPGPIDLATLPFVNVARLFERMGIPVPAVQDAAADLGILVLEDLGDVTLQNHLVSASDAERMARYEEAIGVLEVMQREGQRLASPAYLPFDFAFDVDKLTSELEFFVEHFLVGHRGRAVAASERVALDDEFLTLARELAAEPRVLCHRDYHSRNLMVHDGQLHVIDFQDARMGPDTYDLVSLLRDSYVDLGEPFVEHMLERWVEHAQPAQPSDFRRRFDLMAAQRNLKALGTFGCQIVVHRNPRYLDAIPRTLSYVRDTFERNARFAKLRDLLAAHLDELQ